MGSTMWDARYAAAQIWDLEPSRLVVDAIGKAKKGRALDLGAGEGRHAFWLASKGWTVTAVDHSAVAIGRIQSRSAILGLKVEAITADLTHLTPPVGAFDLVVLSYLDLTEEQWDRAIRTAALALAEEGRLVIVGQDRCNLEMGFAPAANPDLLTTAAVLTRLVNAGGLIVLRGDVVKREVPTDVGVRVAYDHLIEALRFDVPRATPRPE